MKKEEFSIDEIFDTKKGVNERDKRHYKMKHVTVNKQKIFIILGIILLIISVVIMYLLFKNKTDDTNNLIYSEFDALISKFDDKTYYIFGAKNDISFEIEKEADFAYKILDKDENEVKVNVVNNGNNVIIKAPNDLYTEGNTYKLQINNGSFKDDKLKNAKQIIFNIARPSTNSYKLKENIKMIKDSDAKIKDNILTTSGSYQENDILVVMDDNDLKSAYKIVKIDSSNTFVVEIPKTSELFDEIDYYGMEKVNLSEFVTNEELKSFLIMAIGSRSLIII